MFWFGWIYIKRDIQNDMADNGCTFFIITSRHLLAKIRKYACAKFHFLFLNMKACIKTKVYGIWVSKCGMFATVVSSNFIGHTSCQIPIGNFIIIASSKTKPDLLNAKMIQPEVDWLIAYPVNHLLVWWFRFSLVVNILLPFIK